MADRYLPERVVAAQEALSAEPWPHTAKHFLASRYPWGKDDETLRRFNIGLELNDWGRPTILFPTRQLDGEWFYTRRSIEGDGPKYVHTGDTKAPLYLPVPTQEEVVYLTEGHPDTVTARWLGLQAMGLMGTSSWKQHLDYLARFREVRVVMDADKAGWATAAQLFEELCNVRLVFLYPPELDFWAELPRLLSNEMRVDPACAAGEKGHGECKQTKHKTGVAPYTDLKLDLTDVAMKYDAAYALVLLTEERSLFAPGHHTFRYWSREGRCSCGAQLPWSGTAQAGLPRAKALPWQGKPPGLRVLSRYMGAGR